MATGGCTPTPPLSPSKEEPSHKYSAILSTYERLVKAAEYRLTDLVQKLYETEAITETQKETILKISSQEHLDADYSASSLVRFVLKNVECDDRHFDRMLLALRNLKMDGIVEELLGAYENRLSGSTSEEAMDLNGTNLTQGASLHSPNNVQPKTTNPGEEMMISFSDSGIHVNANHLNNSTSSMKVCSPDEPQPESILHLSQTAGTSFDQQNTILALQESETEQASLPSLHIPSPSVESHSDTVVANSDSVENSLQSHPQLQELAEVDITAVQPAPIQVHNEESSAMLLVSQTGQHYSSHAEDGSGSTSEALVDHLTQRLTQMRLELQNKERELEARAQEVQQNSELLVRCHDLEEKVKTMENEVKTQKRRADKVSNDKDIEINSWKKKCEQKECEIQELRVTIAKQEQEKSKLTKAHVAEILKLREQQQESARKLESYEEKVAALDRALNEANQKKSEAEEQLKEADSKIQQAERERHQAEIQLLHNLVAKERELSQLKEENHKLELEIKKLECKNQELAMETKDKQVLLHQKDKELAEHKLAEVEEKHETCVRELTSERRQSLCLQNENHQLKRQLSEFQEKCVANESPAKRSKTE